MTIIHKQKHILFLLLCIWIVASSTSMYAQTTGEPSQEVDTSSSKQLVLAAPVLQEEDKVTPEIDLNALLASQPAEIPSGYVLIGDMILPISAVQSTTRAFYSPKLWNNGKIYYQFAGNVSQQNRDRARDAMDDWEAASGVQFIPRTTQVNYIHIFSGSGNWSFVGRIGGKQDVSIKDWASHGTLLHELGHVLGFLHEHTRGDRDQYIQIQLNNVTSGTESQFAIATDGVEHGVYDFVSVMHYTQYAFSKNGQPTMVARPGYEQFQNTMGTSNNLSQRDKNAAMSLYPVQVVNPDIRMSLGKPANNAVVTSPVNIFGWAFDRNAGFGNGTGVSQIAVFKGNTCSGTLLGASPLNQNRQGVVDTFGLDNSYLMNGFNFDVNITPPGVMNITVCARSSATGDFRESITHTISVETPAPDMRMSLAKPSSNQTLNSPFRVRGWVYDQNAGAGNGTGVNRVGVFQGNSCNGILLGSTVQNENRSDVVQAFNLDNSYLTNGFNFFVPATTDGPLTFTVCARSSSNNTYYPGITQTVNILTGPDIRMSLAKPSQNATVSSPFIVRGWAYDRNAGTGNGTGVSQISVFQGNNCGGTLLGSSVQNENRSDVTQVFNLDNSYLKNGFKFNVPINASGNVNITVCIRASSTNNYEQSMTQTINVQNGPDIRMSLGKPNQGQGVTGSFVVGGWAYDRNAGTGNGTGVSQIAIYQGKTCGGNLLHAGQQNVNRQDIVDIFNLDNSYLKSGYSFSIGPVAGNYTFTVCARSSDTNQFETSITRTVNGSLNDESAKTLSLSLASVTDKQAIEQPELSATPTPNGLKSAPVLSVPTVVALQPVIEMNIDNPVADETVTGAFSISGWAFDRNAGSGTGIRHLALFQGQVCRGEPMKLTTPSIQRSDVVAQFGLDSSYLVNGYRFDLRGLIGELEFTVCAFSNTTNEYEAKLTRKITGTMNAAPSNDLNVALGEPVTENTVQQAAPTGLAAPTTSAPEIPTVESLQPVIEMNIDSPLEGEMVTGAFSISGWAFDRNAGAGNGTGIRHLALFQGQVCRGEPMKLTTPNMERSDVVAQFGLDNSYLISGYRFDIRGLIGELEFTVCAFSDVTNEYEGKLTRKIIGSMPANDVEDTNTAAVEEVQEPVAIPTATTPTEPTVQATIQERLIRMSVGSPTDQETVTSEFSVYGWAYDENAGAGNGTGIQQIVVFNGVECKGDVLIFTRNFTERQDVVDAHGLDPSYLNTGYSLTVNAGTATELTFTVCARSTATNQFGPGITRTVQIQ